MRLTIPLVALLLVPRLAGAQRSPPQATVPPRGFVPDSITAVRIAVAVWIPLYGESEIKTKQPFVATLKDSVWTVTATPHSTAYILLGGTIIEGGAPVAKIVQRDARILLASQYW
jgi:NTF2 fold immunity protein of polymorphic toxin system component